MVSIRLRQEMESLRATLSHCEATLSQVAGAAQVETLGLVVEEQRQRIDSIITGTFIPLEVHVDLPTTLIQLTPPFPPASFRST